MKTFGKIAFMLVAALFFLQSFALAETIQGRVLRVDQEAGLVVLREIGPEASATAEVEVPVLPETQLIGFQALADLEADDEVSVVTEENAETGESKTLSIELVESEPAETLE